MASGLVTRLTLNPSCGPYTTTPPSRFVATRYLHIPSAGKNAVICLPSLPSHNLDHANMSHAMPNMPRFNATPADVIELQDLDTRGYAKNNEARHVPVAPTVSQTPHVHRLRTDTMQRHSITAPLRTPGRCPGCRHTRAVRGSTPSSHPGVFGSQAASPGAR
jgi:hypothetical protein